jgi:hypothetical protein
VPVTAKFSKEFYERFGHAVADELVNWFNQVDATHRNDLRELNELNFARFDAKLEQRAAQLEAKLDQRTTQIEAKIETGLARLEGGLLARIGQAEGRLARMTLALWVTTLATLVALLKL